MRLSKSAVAIGPLLLVVLLASIDVHAAVIGQKLSIQQQQVSVVADTQNGSLRQGTISVNGTNWVCSGTNCNALIIPAAVVSPVVLCQLLAREVGAMRSFAVASRPMNTKELLQCNSVALPSVTVTPPPAFPAAPSSTSGSSSYPISIRTDRMTVTGTGLLMDRAVYSPKNIRTDRMMVTGTGNLTVYAPFTPKSIRTDGMTVTGTGLLH